MTSTHCLVCKRSGKGWSITNILEDGKLVYGCSLLENVDDYTGKHGGLNTWIKKTNRDTYKSDPCLVYAVYIYDIEAPGQWCQMFWECIDENQAKRVKNKIEASSRYLIDRTLSELTSDEIEYYYEYFIRA